MFFAFALGGLFVFMTMVFVVIAVFFPEWVGIQGKVAKQFEQDQLGKHDQLSAETDEVLTGQK